MSNGHIHVCAKCMTEHNSPRTYDPPGWIWRSGRLYCDSCASTVTDDIDDAAPHGAARDLPAPVRIGIDFASDYVQGIARDLPPTERQALLLLRPDGKGNYDKALTRARDALQRKGLADSPITFGLGRVKFAVRQKPTDLGRAVAACLQREAA